MGRIASSFRQKRADPARDRPMAMLREVVTRIDAAPSPVGHEDTEPFSGPVSLTGCFWVVLRKHGLILRESGLGQGDILTKCGHENAMLSGRTIDVPGSQHLA